MTARGGIASTSRGTKDRARRCRLTAAAVGLAATLAVPAEAATPEILIFGGGWGPDGTQRSIEAHVLALAKALDAHKPTILFGGGPKGTRSVQVKSSSADEATRVLGLIFDRPANLDVGYRAPLIDADGPARKTTLLLALSRIAKQPAILFGVGHGSRPVDDGPPVLDLWGGAKDALGVAELSAALDARTAPITVVLGQCYSGGFAELMYRSPSSGQALAKPTRCVLSAVPSDREASGCTADIRDPGARAYVAVVSEALAGARGADLDGDGKVSIAEAHSYARIHDPTIDVPVSTSEAWLRAVVAELPPRIAGRDVAALVKAARLTERAVLLALSPKTSIAEAEAMFDTTAGQIDTLDKTIADLDGSRADLRRRLEDRVVERWPELANPFHAIARALLAVSPSPIVTFAKGQPELAEIERIDRRIHLHSTALDKLERSSAKLERWLRAVEIVVYEQAIRRSATAAQKADLDQLLACESTAP